ncbi:AraC family transcriptional regulator [Enterocloster bolteae]|uniref:AraC family transcriptional regulator n=1 Tax=Enterocloster bolteae TaxID=208479 RepID=UPI00210D626D|nr:AraC family transcriptional regulator [Enterocloster bolteae]MCQ5141562.1 AraC family transcriptional regulator [Enterocloster bolteae]
MAYKSVVLEDSVTINRIISVHYFQYMSDFSFPGESHDFWELVCVDRGEIDALAGDRRLTLKKGNILFHKPNEFHNVLTNGKVSPSLVVIGFECHSPAIKSFEDQLMSVQDTEKELLAQIIVEARNTFSGRLDDPYQEELIFNSEPLTFGSAQLISHYLEQLMIHLYRRYFSYSLPVRSSRFLAEACSGNDTYNRIVRYMEEHLGERMTIDRICRDNLVGRSQLQKLFRDTKGCGVIEFFSMMKIDTAKQMIRDNQLNFTQIADRLGYNSIHYFSRQFKQITTMTPSEYATSIRLLSEKP